MDSPEQTVERMTEAQKACLNYVRPHSWIAPFRHPVECRELIEQGLLERAIHEAVSITPHGQAVRALLEKQS